MIRDGATGAVSDVRTTAVCSCGGQFNRYVLLTLPYPSCYDSPTHNEATLTKPGT